MSLDLHLFNVPPLNFKPQSNFKNSSISSSCANKFGEEELLDQDLSLKTPISEANKIPVTITCPPAPKKRKSRNNASSCKRKLDFFDVVNRREIDEFFTSSFKKLRSLDL